MLQRYSSRRQKLNQTFINERLQNAVSYDRIAGFFRSSMLEVAGEAVQQIRGKVRVVCNSEIDIRDVETAKAAQQAQRRSWCDAEPEQLGASAQPRFQQLYRLLATEKLEVRVLPDEVFGLIHGKAGVITYADGRKTCFMGSANESLTAWKLNYELVWEDDSPEGIAWVQQEFDALWNHPKAMPLSDFVVTDIKRLSHRREIDIETWRKSPQAAASVIETPVYRKAYGLWAHQKYFVKLAYDAHLNGGARYVLADQVGLGKTVQLALAAMLMALHSDRPILVLAPKQLMLQWQDELYNLLDMPSALWNGKGWVDEQGIEYPSAGPEAIRKCPRRVGIVSQGLITAKSPIAEELKGIQYECIIVDEAHRARRRELSGDSVREKGEPNNLMAFLTELSPSTKSMLLATATPVQLHPIEAWDLVNIVATGNNQVLGELWSEWRKPEQALNIAMGTVRLPDDIHAAWRWIRNPFPPASEGTSFRRLRKSLGLKDNEFVAPGDSLDGLRAPELTRLKSIAQDFGTHHNPFIRHIVRRTRDFLENTIDPTTGEPYLKPVKVQLFGESRHESIPLPPYLQDAYDAAEHFCALLSRRVKGAGFLKTLLLRRIGSTIYAGRQTTEKMLAEWGTDAETTFSNELFEEEDDIPPDSGIKDLTPEERLALQRCLKALEANEDRDPKYHQIVEYLLERKWLELGCIVFSQYFDSIWGLGEQLSTEVLSDEPLGIYAGGVRSGIIESGHFRRVGRDTLKQQVRHGELRLILGTDAASEGLNLQRLGSLINLDLPWNPTRLEQRKGRIQRIGQLRDAVYLLNMRYRGSVEDRVHELLSERLEDIFNLFGQIPDVLEDVWIEIATGQIEAAKKIIDAVQPRHPFDEKYNRVEELDWESCVEVLNAQEKLDVLKAGW
jgi:hypothetical protein